jgi:hypothetical protein
MVTGGLLWQWKTSPKWRFGRESFFLIWCIEVRISVAI